MGNFLVIFVVHAGAAIGRPRARLGRERRSGRRCARVGRRCRGQGRLDASTRCPGAETRVGENTARRRQHHALGGTRYCAGRATALFRSLICVAALAAHGWGWFMGAAHFRVAFRRARPSPVKRISGVQGVEGDAQRARDAYRTSRLLPCQTGVEIPPTCHVFVAKVGHVPGTCRYRKRTVSLLSIHALNLVISVCRRPLSK